MNEDLEMQNPEQSDASIQQSKDVDRGLVLRAKNVALFYQNRLSWRSSKRNRHWALKDVSFDLYEGECLGIIGRNGAGKSSLMRLIAGIHKPNKGEFKSFGNSVALLTLGAGFMNHLSGRDNMILSAQLLGLSKEEIRNRLHSMIEYSELGKFIDAPLYTYSSGMRARLGFAVAVQSDPKVLLIDETLGVGDASFREKSSLSIQRMILEEGRTVIIISHNPQTIDDLASRIIWLKDGKAIQGDKSELIKEYNREILRGIQTSPETSELKRSPTQICSSENRADENDSSCNKTSKVPKTESETTLLLELKKAIAVEDLAALNVLVDEFEKKPRKQSLLRSEYIRAIGMIGNFQKGIDYIEAHQDELTSLQLQETIALYYFALNDLEKADKQFTRMIAEGFNHRSLALNKAYLASLRGEHETARYFYRLLPFIDPKFTSSILASPIEDLIAFGFENVVERHKSNTNSEPENVRIRALAYANLFLGKHKESLDCIQKLSTSVSSSFTERIWRSRILRIAGSLSESEQQMRQLKKEQPTSIYPIVEHASLELALGRT